MITYEKKDDNTLKVIEPKEVKQPSVTETVTHEYEYNFLIEQKVSITKQRDEIIAIKEKELAEVDLLIIEAEKLGITEVVKEITK